MNAPIDEPTALRLHGMAACAHDLPSVRKPPGPTTATRQPIDAETLERRVRSIRYRMRIAGRVRTGSASFQTSDKSYNSKFKNGLQGSFCM